MPRYPTPTPEKRCSTCGVRLSRKRFHGRLEDLTAYKARLFCSLSCANSRTKGGTSRKAYHAQARKQRKPNCEACGTQSRLQVHHVNEDWRDNRPENLQTLCVFCHQYWHGTHRRLGVKPTLRMPPLFFRSPTESPAAWDDCAPTGMRSSRKSPPKSSARISKE